MKFVILAIITFMTTHAFANRVSPIEANLRCEQAGGGIAIKFPSQSSPARAWQTDTGVEQGLEINLTDYKTARCAGCLIFDGEVMGLKVQGAVSNFLLTYSIFNPQKNAWEVVLKNVPCK